VDSHPPLKQVRLVDVRDVYERHVRGKLLVYLDTNVFINLTRQKPTIDSSDAVACLAACRRAKASGRVLFPLSHALISELLEQKLSDEPTSRTGHLARAALMDELSDGVSFRATHHIYDLEAEAAVPLLSGTQANAPDHTRMFTYAAEWPADRVLEFPPSAVWTDAAIQSLLKHAEKEWPSNSVLPLLERAGEQVRSSHRAIRQGKQAELAQSIARAADNVRNTNGSVNWTRALRQEQEHVFRSCVLPALRRALAIGRPPNEASSLIAAAERLVNEGNGNSLTLGQLLAAMPATGHHAELFARRVMNPERTYVDGDFLDNEHAEVPPAYCRAVVTERGLATLLRQCDVPKARGCAFISAGNGRSLLFSLTEWLEEQDLA
jgi:hypothetical protein